MNNLLEGDRLLAGRVAARADLADIRLLRSSFELERFPDGEHRLGWNLDVRPDVELEPGADHFVVTCDYELRVLELADEETAQDAVVTELSFTFAALFDLNEGAADEVVTTEELAAYARASGAFALYPYAREYVQDTTLRLGLPGLTLGVYRLEFTPADGEAGGD